MADFEKILRFFGVDIEAAKNKTENTYQIGGSVVEFFGLESNEAKAHGPRRDILFINEVNRRVSYEVYDHLASRTQECVFLDFNPYISGWLQETVMPNYEHELIHSTYLDNPYLPASERENIEMKREKDPMWFQVYGLGLLGSLAGAILTDWHYGEWDKSLSYSYGLDFGFRDEDALVRVAIDRKRKIIYCDEKIYKSGNSVDQLRQLIAQHSTRNDLIVADCADQRMISELKKYFNIIPVNKAKWTISEALKMMQDYEIVITEDSKNLAKELDNYIWSDKKAGIPIGEYNHLIDALRYVFQHSINGGVRSHQIWHF